MPLKTYRVAKGALSFPSVVNTFVWSLNVSSV